MNSRDNHTGPRSWRAAVALLVVAGVAGLGAWVLLQRPGKVPAKKTDREAPRHFAAGRPRFDDSGFTFVGKLAARRLRDPLSLPDIRNAFQGVGPYGIGVLQRELETGLPPEAELDHLLVIASLHLYEGEFIEAGEALAWVRERIKADPKHLQNGLATVIFLQGLAGLRRGEVENCLECTTMSRCIFPIRPEAIHHKPEGSREAMRFFTEYLEGQPDDIAVRWLLNVAAMTLGEYPEGVPEPYRIPLEAFRSEFDIGRFTDIAARLGVDRLSQAGGAIMDDFDNDGLLDLVTTSMDPGTPMAFFRNKGDGTFEDRTRAAGLEDQLGGLYCVQTDYNNDGWLDIFIPRGAWVCPQRPSLLRNNRDGTFTDVTREAGLLVAVDSQVAAWADFDNDGFLDLFLGGETVPSRLFRNKGDGTFEDVTDRAGVGNAGFMCKGATWGDYDGDGYPDLYLANINGPPRLFHNNRDGTFTDVARDLGITQPVEGFSCWFWDYDNDGWLDIFATAYERGPSTNILSQLGLPHEGATCRLYRNLGGKRFEDVSAAVGLNLAMAPMGSNFGDFDNDGFLDIYLGTGTPSYALVVPNRMFKNVDGKRFADITTSSGTGHLQKGHAVACGDWDRDGNIDIYEQLGGAVPGDRFRNVLFQNPGHDNHWITVKLAGKQTNRPGIGARIKVSPVGDPPRAIYRHVTSGSSFGANPLQQTIGIGKADRIATLELYWPTSRTTQVFHDVPVDQAIEVTEFETAYRVLDWKRIARPQ
jgi:hypothetical protein